MNEQDITLPIGICGGLAVFSPNHYVLSDREIMVVGRTVGVVRGRASSPGNGFRSVTPDICKYVHFYCISAASNAWIM